MSIVELYMLCSVVYFLYTFAMHAYMYVIQLYRLIFLDLKDKHFFKSLRHLFSVRQVVVCVIAVINWD